MDAPHPASTAEPGNVVERQADSRMVLAANGLVLIVEDDPSTRSFEASALLLEGYAVLEAADGDEGLRLARSCRPDVIILDLGLPVRTGLDVLRELEADPATTSIPVLVVSAYSLLAGPHHLLHARAVIQKPFNLADLLAHVHHHTPTRQPSTAHP